jgi:hypothetical protein
MDEAFMMHKNTRYDYKILVHLDHLGTDGA